MEISSVKNNLTPGKIASLMLVIPLFGIVAVNMLMVAGGVLTPRGTNFQMFCYGFGATIAMVAAILALYSWFIVIKNSRTY